MINFIDELKEYIVDNTNLIFGTNLFIGDLSDASVNSVMMITQAPKFNYVLGKKIGYYEQNFFFKIRGNNLENDTRLIASNLTNALENLYNKNWGKYHLIKGKFETPFYQLEGKDNFNCFIYVGVYNCIFEITTLSI